MEQVKGNYLKALKILHSALLIGQVLFLAVTVFIVMRNLPIANPSLDKTLQVAAILISFGGIFMASTIFKGKLAAINTAESNVDKADQYRAANITRWAMIEGPALFVIICFFLTGNYSFAALALAIIIYFFLLGPSRLKTMLQLQLSEEEVDDL